MPGIVSTHTQLIKLHLLHTYTVCQTPSYTVHLKASQVSLWCCLFISKNKSISIPYCPFWAAPLKTICCPLAVQSFPHLKDTPCWRIWAVKSSFSILTLLHQDHSHSSQQELSGGEHRKGLAIPRPKNSWHPCSLMCEEKLNSFVYYIEALLQTDFSYTHHILSVSLPWFT